MQLKEVYDPRSPVEKYRRTELYYIALYNKIPMDPSMPAPLMRRKLQAANVRSWPRPLFNLNSNNSRTPSYEDWQRMVFGVEKPQSYVDTQEVSADDLLEAEWEANKRARPLEKMTVFELYKECKTRGVKWKKTDKKKDLLAKIKEHDG